MIVREKVEAVIGKGFADKLDEEVFSVTTNFFYTRREMVEELGCANFIAAVRLQKVLRKLDVRTPAQLFKTDPFSLARARGIGEASLFVAMCILDANKFDVLKWWQWNGNTAKFSSFKAHAIHRASKRKQEVD
jgi:hypothetical protein